MINIKPKDLITLENDQKYAVLSQAEYNNEHYYYLVSPDNNLKIMFAKLEGDQLREIEDEKILEIIIPSLSNNSMNILKDILKNKPDNN